MAVVSLAGSKFRTYFVMKKLIGLIAFSVVLFVGCGKEPLPETPGGGGNEDDGGGEVIEKKIPINIAGTADNAFDFGATMGVYVVNNTSAGAGTLLPNGNHADNICFTYSNTWSPETTIYWADQDTKADIYCYAPYSRAISDVENHLFSVATNQSDNAAYKSSDLLWGKSSNVAPTDVAISVKMARLMSRVVVELVAGNGYTQEQLASAKVSICSVQADAKINLATGSVSPTGTTTEIATYNSAEEYQAVVVPQTINNADLVKVTIDNKDYTLQQSLTLESGKQHKCTVTISKVNQGLNIGISDWAMSTDDYGGIVK